MKEQVARILGNMTHEIKQCDCKDPVLGLEIKQATLEICQLFEPKPIDCKNCEKIYDCGHTIPPDCPKPDEGRLLTDEKLNDIEADVWYDTNLTNDDKNNPTMIKFIIRERQNRAQRDLTRKECQERVGRIFKEFEKYLTEVLGHNPEELRVWQALKEKELK